MDQRGTEEVIFWTSKTYWLLGQKDANVPSRLARGTEAQDTLLVALDTLSSPESIGPNERNQTYDRRTMDRVPRIALGSKWPIGGTFRPQSQQNSVLHREQVMWLQSAVGIVGSEEGPGMT